MGRTITLGRTDGQNGDSMAGSRQQPTPGMVEFDGIPFTTTLTAAAAGDVSQGVLRTPLGGPIVLTGLWLVVLTAGVTCRLESLKFDNNGTDLDSLGAGLNADLLDPSLTTEYVSLSVDEPFESFDCRVNFSAAGSCDVIYFFDTPDDKPASRLKIRKRMPAGMSAFQPIEVGSRRR